MCVGIEIVTIMYSSMCEDCDQDLEQALGFILLLTAATNKMLIQDSISSGDSFCFVTPISLLLANLGIFL